ncbi:MAG: hypothetical protein QME94_17885 [Anaerolineae bacterium]|nr:hypothetical protein [Anaerolineae bacterium]
MAQIHFILTSGAEVTGVIQGDAGHVASQVQDAMTGGRPIIVYGLPDLEGNAINVVNPAAVAAARILEEAPLPAH